MRTAIVLSRASVLALMIAASVQAQQAAPAAPQPPLPYGMPISLALAEKAAAAAEAETRKTGFPSGITIVGPNAEIILEEKMDNSNNSELMAAEQKARGAALYRHPTKFFQDRLIQAPYVVQLAGVSMIGGGIPLVVDGHIVGALGVSGAPSADGDMQAAQSGVDALK